MRHVAHFDVDGELEQQRRTVGDFQVEDVAAIGADDADRGGERTRLVLHTHQHAGDGLRGFRRARAPFHVQPVGHVGLRAFELFAVDRMHDDALARHHQAHDAVARQRMAALAETIGNALRQALNGNRLACGLPSSAVRRCA